MPTSRNNLGLGIIEKLHYGKMFISFDSFLKSQKIKFKKEKEKQIIKNDRI